MWWFCHLKYYVIFYVLLEGSLKISLDSETIHLHYRRQVTHACIRKLDHHFFLYNDVLPTQHQAHIQTNASSLSIRSFSAYINEFNLNDNLKVAFAQWLPFGLGLSVLTSDQYPGIMPHMNPLHRYGFTYHKLYSNNLLGFSHTLSTLKFALNQILVTASWPPKH